MKDHFIKSFVYGLGNTTATLTVLGIFSGIWYLVNNASFKSEQQAKTIKANQNVKNDQCQKDEYTECAEDTERENRMQMYQMLAAQIFETNNENSKDIDTESMDHTNNDLSFSFCEDETRYKSLLDKMLIK